jgi:hypothetical protein
VRGLKKLNKKTFHPKPPIDPPPLNQQKLKPPAEKNHNFGGPGLGVGALAANLFSSFSLCDFATLRLCGKSSLLAFFPLRNLPV